MQGWLLNISSLQQLWENVQTQYNFKYLLTRRINQDCLEHFFGCLRQCGGNNYTPTIKSLISAIKHVTCNQLLNTGKNGNCEDDTTPLLDYIQIFTNDKPAILEEMYELAMNDDDNDEQTLNDNENDEQTLNDNGNDEQILNDNGNDEQIKNYRDNMNIPQNHNSNIDVAL